MYRLQKTMFYGICTKLSLGGDGILTFCIVAS